MSATYDYKDEGTHQVDTDDPHWQESVFVHW
jgi:hypothetical protein